MQTTCVCNIILLTIIIILHVWLYNVMCVCTMLAMCTRQLAVIMTCEDTHVGTMHAKYYYYGCFIECGPGCVHMACLYKELFWLPLTACLKIWCLQGARGKIEH